MKKLLPIIFFTVTAYNLDAQWLQTSGPSTVFIHCFQSFGSNLYAGTSNGLFSSSDNGTTWNSISNGLTNTSVKGLAVIGTTLFAGTGGGVFTSINNGANWLSSSGSSSISVSAMEVETGGSRIFLGGSGVYRGDMNAFGTYIWTAAGSGITSGVLSLAIKGTNVFAGTFNGIYLSTINGTSWAPVNSGLATGDINALATDGVIIYASVAPNGGIYASSNNGNSWYAVNNGLPASPNIKSIIVNGTNIFAGGANGGVYLSTNAGANWTTINTGLPTNMNILSLGIAGSDLYAGTNGSNVWKRPLNEIISGIAEEKENRFSVKLYPNPTNSKINIEVKNPISSIAIYNLIGSKLISVNYNNFEKLTEIDLSNFEKGIYFLEATIEEKIVTRKFIIQ